MGTYLKRFSERVVDVPAYLRRHLALIRDLDDKVVQLQQEIELHSKKRLAAKEAEQQSSKKQKLQGEPPTSYDVESAVTRLLSLADEKVGMQFTAFNVALAITSIAHSPSRFCLRRSTSPLKSMTSLTNTFSI